MIRTVSYFKTGKIELDFKVFYESFESVQLSPFLTCGSKKSKVVLGDKIAKIIFEKHFDP